MDTLADDDPMEIPPQAPLAGLDPAALLRQGAAEDTLPGDGLAASFHPPSVEEMVELFPRFEILELIGHGGMGAVYKVRQKDLDRVVALKILPPAISETAGFSERFTLEAKALAKLNHPGIVTIHEFGSAASFQPSTANCQPLYFILMEFVDGVNLGQLMRGGRIAPREALAIVPQICDALQFAHDRGIVHRDIKPENILLDRHGRVKVADFGIAKVMAEVRDSPVASVCDRPSHGTQERRSQTDATIPGKVMGTPQYMAPEQIDRPSEVDHRADIYALGIVFYQMLTGELPGKDLQAPSKKVRIDVRLDEIVMQALEKNPELRYQQASVFKTKIEEAGKVGEVNKWSHMNRETTFLLIVSVLMFLSTFDFFPSAIRGVLWLILIVVLGWWFVLNKLLVSYREGIREGMENSQKPVSREKSSNQHRSPLWAIVGIALILCLPLAVWVAFDQRSRQAVEHVEDHIFTIPSNTSTEDAREILTMAMGPFQDVALSHFSDSRQWRLSAAGPSQKMVQARIREAVEAVRHNLTLNRKRVLSVSMSDEESRTVSSQLIPWNGDPGFLTKLRIYLIVGIICATLGFLCLLQPRYRRSNGWIATALVMWLAIAGVAIYLLRPDRFVRFDPWIAIDVPPSVGAGDAASEPGMGAPDRRERVDAAVREWLGMIDGGNLGDAWAEMSELAKSLQTESGWEAMLMASREPLGDVVVRELVGSGYASRLGAFGNLSNRVFKYRTDFKHGKGFETVTLVLEESGDLRVLSYVIESQSLASETSEDWRSNEENEALK